MESYILDAAINRNENHDRSEKDWLLDKGRVIMQMQLCLNDKQDNYISQF